jgi:hypothetical protein
MNIAGLDDERRNAGARVATSKRHRRHCAGAGQASGNSSSGGADDDADVVEQWKMNVGVSAANDISAWMVGIFFFFFFFVVASASW